MQRSDLVLLMLVRARGGGGGGGLMCKILLCSLLPYTPKWATGLFVVFFMEEGMQSAVSHSYDTHICHLLTDFDDSIHDRMAGRDSFQVRMSMRPDLAYQYNAAA